jgi:hypothetical protein
LPAGSRGARWRFATSPERKLCRRDQAVREQRELRERRVEIGQPAMSRQGDSRELD